MLDLKNLKGMWAGLPIPWDVNGDFDEGTFIENVSRCIKAGIPAIYTGGSTGEFFACDFELFKKLTDALLETVKGTDVLTQVGIIAQTTEEVIKRGSYAIEKGADGLQVTFPYWTKLTESEAVSFYRDLNSAFESFPIIHYDIWRNKYRLDKDILSKISDVYPGLIGVKFTGSDLSKFAELASSFPKINFFVGEFLLASAAPFGAKGCYSSLVYMCPPLMLKYFNSCANGMFKEAIGIQKKIAKLMQGIEILGIKSIADAPYDKALCAASGFIKGSLSVKKPYESASSYKLEEFRKWVEENVPEFLIIK
ncbi:MAG: dihydrodipicolinate synthase family protein [Actinomycetia bacterium]|nr:dihydrodipicolinate synthase family protein [Actinomycetes bacterium]